MENRVFFYLFNVKVYENRQTSDEEYYTSVFRNLILGQGNNIFSLRQSRTRLSNKDMSLSGVLSVRREHTRIYVPSKYNVIGNYEDDDYSFDEDLNDFFSYAYYILIPKAHRLAVIPREKDFPVEEFAEFVREKLARRYGRRSVIVHTEKNINSFINKIKKIPIESLKITFDLPNNDIDRPNILGRLLEEAKALQGEINLRAAKGQRLQISSDGIVENILSHVGSNGDVIATNGDHSHTADPKEFGVLKGSVDEVVDKVVEKVISEFRSNHGDNPEKD